MLAYVMTYILLIVYYTKSPHHVFRSLSEAFALCTCCILLKCLQ